MGTIVNRNKEKVHEKGKTMNTNNSYNTSVQYCEESYVGRSKRTIRNIDYDPQGCCTNTKNAKTSGVGNHEWMFVKYTLSDLATIFRDLKFLKEWIRFINEGLPFADVHIVMHEDGKVLSPEFWEERNISFKATKKIVVFAIKKTKNASHSYKNLFVLSLIRAIAHSMYFYFAYDCVRLRKLKSLESLSNWDIMNIAKYGAQGFDTRDNTTMLYGYRFPLETMLAPKSYPPLDVVIDRLEKGSYQNTACAGEIMFINVIYLMLLFQKKQYKKLHSIITDPKHIVSQGDKDFSTKFNAFQREQYSSQGHFEGVNNIKHDYVAYGKTL